MQLWYVQGPLTPSKARATTPSVMPDMNSSSADRALVGRIRSGRQLITNAEAAPLQSVHHTSISGTLTSYSLAIDELSATCTASFKQHETACRQASNTKCMQGHTQGQGKSIAAAEGWPGLNLCLA